MDQAHPRIIPEVFAKTKIIIWDWERNTNLIGKYNLWPLNICKWTFQIYCIKPVEGIH